MRIEIETANRDLLMELVGKPPFRTINEPIPAPEGVRLVFGGMTERRGLDFPTVVHFVVEHLDEVTTGLFASWLYDKLKDRARRLRINGQEIQLTPDALKRIFERQAKDNQSSNGC